MKKIEIDILGFNNLAVAIFIDMLKDIYGHLPQLTIVKNISDERNIYREYPFRLEDDLINVIQEDEWIFNEKKKLIIGAAAGKTLHTIYHHFKQKVPLKDEQFINLIHPTSYVAESAKIGVGVSIEPHTTVSSFATLENHVQLKRNVSIGHHTTISSFTNVNPGVNIAGRCNIGEQCLIGVGATISNDISIGNNSVIGAGSVVTKDIPDNVIAYGVPAKIMKTNS